MSKEIVFRVHPTINFARVGNSDEFNYSPETTAGIPSTDGTVGGLPINPETGKVINAKDLRDSQTKLKRQAARFRLYAYEVMGRDEYPTKFENVEVYVGTKLSNGKI